ncbi:MAG: hypothetical protein HOV97_05930 [Nonomuraea sp.]|nr:hypothetical protein [Nonomuraea sp.]
MSDEHKDCIPCSDGRHEVCMDWGSATLGVVCACKKRGHKALEHATATLEEQLIEQVQRAEWAIEKGIAWRDRAETAEAAIERIKAVAERLSHGSPEAARAVLSALEGS